MKEMAQRWHIQEKTARKTTSKAERAVIQEWVECQHILQVEHLRLLSAMMEMAQNYQVDPVYPSDDNLLEWHDPTPELDCIYPRSPSDKWNKVYYND
jgi:hypothetical protein